MAKHARLPDVSTFAERATTAHRAASGVHASHFKTLATIKANAEQLPGAEVLRRQMEARSGALGTIAAHDLDALAAEGERLAAALNPDEILRTARFLPPISDPGAEAADLRRIAERYERLNYRERLQRLGANVADEADRIVREAGADAGSTAALAMLDELNAHTNTLPAGPAHLAARAKVGAAQAVVLKNWTSYAAAVEAHKSATRALGVAQRLAGEVHVGRTGNAFVKVA